MKKLNLATGRYAEEPLYEMAEKINEIVEIVSLCAETLGLPGYEDELADLAPIPARTRKGKRAGVEAKSTKTEGGEE